MLTAEQDAVLEAMRVSPQKPWRSTELKEIVLGRFPGTHDRKIRRCLEGLEQSGWIARGGIGRATTWRLSRAVPARAMRRPPADLALALMKLRQLAGRHLPQQFGDYEEYFASASQVLAESTADSRLNSARAWLGKTLRLDPGYPVIAPAIEPVVFDTVLTALYRDETLVVEYRKAEHGPDETKTYRVLPYAIVEKGPYWYLVVRHRRSSGQQGDAFLLRCDRIVEATNVGYELARQSDFDLDKFVRQERVLEWFPEDPKPLVLRIYETPGIPNPLRSLRLSPDQRLEEEGGDVVLRATVTPSVALRNLLLQYAPFVEVIAPDSLRTEMGQMLEAAAIRYRQYQATPAAEADPATVAQ